MTASCLINAEPRSPWPGKRSTVKAILARGVVFEPREGAFGLLGGTACYQDNTFIRTSSRSLPSKHCSTSFSSVFPVGLFVALCLTVSVPIGTNYVFEDRKRPGSKAIRHCRKERVNNVSVCKQDQDTVNVIGFLGLVGKETDVARGLLVDTGASINVHGQNLFEQFTEIVLKARKLWRSEF